MRRSFRKYCKGLLTMISVVVALVVALPEIGGVESVSAQTKTATQKKKKSTSSSGSQKKSLSNQKKSSSTNKKNSSSQKKTSSTQKKTTAPKKNAVPIKKGTQTQKKGSSAQKKATSNQSSSRKGNTYNKKGVQTQKKASQTGTPKSSAEAKKLQEATQREIQQTREKLRLNEEQIKTGLSDLNRLSGEIATGRTQVEVLQKKVAGLTNEIANLSNEITKNEAELKLMREEYLKAVKKMRLTKRNQSTLAFIFASENFNQAMRRIRYMRQFSAWKERKSADIDGKIEQLGKERERLAEAKEAQTVALGQLTESQTQLEENHKKQEQLVASLRQNGDALQAHLSAKQKEANRLKETISALIAQEQAKAEAERKAREKAEAERKAKAEADRIAREKAEAEKKDAAERAAKDKKLAEKPGKDKKKEKKNSEKSARKKSDRRDMKGDNSKDAVKSEEPLPNIAPKNAEKSGGIDFASLRGSLPRPVDGSWRITNQFGRHAMPEMPEIEYDNPGIDAEVANGATVKSVCGGMVSGVYKVAGYGTVVIVNHGDYYTVYGNLASTNVAVGTRVGGGHVLGTAGKDPDDPRRSSVHFEVWKGREKQNPSVWLR